MPRYSILPGFPPDRPLPVPVQARSYPSWVRHSEGLVIQLRAKPSGLRIAYAAGVDAALAQRRSKAIESEMQARWKALQNEYPLVIEIEGAQRQKPPLRPAIRTEILLTKLLQSPEGVQAFKRLDLSRYGFEVLDQTDEPHRSLKHGAFHDFE